MRDSKALAKPLPLGDTEGRPFQDRPPSRILVVNQDGSKTFGVLSDGTGFDNKDLLALKSGKL